MVRLSQVLRRDGGIAAMIQLERKELMLLALLRAALHGSIQADTSIETASDADWRECYKLACAQGVMAIAWDGYVLMQDHCSLPRDLKLNWGLAVQRYEEKYERYCAAASELSDFYAEHGIAMIQMKGVGLSSYYPHPEHREGGDIDIYTYSADRSRMSDEEANSLADKLMSEKDIEVDDGYAKHSCFFYKGIPVENHKRFLNVDSFKIAAEMNNLLLEVMAPRQVQLCGGKYAISVPSPEFNALFLSFHAAQHYGAGLALHHIVDWAVLLKEYGLCMPAGVSDSRFLRFVDGLTEICRIYLAVDVAPGSSAEMADEIFSQLMRPKFPHKAAPQNMNKLQILVYKTRRMLCFHRLQATVFDSSLSERIWKSVIAHIKKPDTIFKTQ